jgi:hypothetical protein
MQDDSIKKMDTFALEQLQQWCDPAHLLMLHTFVGLIFFQESRQGICQQVECIQVAAVGRHSPRKPSETCISLIQVNVHLLF